MDDCADPLLGIVYNNDSYAVEAWRSSYTIKMQKGSYTKEAWMIVLIHFWVSSTVMIPTSWKRGDVPTPWKCEKGPIPWKHERLY